MTHRLLRPILFLAVRKDTVCGVLVQYPATNGRIHDFRKLAEQVLTCFVPSPCPVYPFVLLVLIPVLVADV